MGIGVLEARLGIDKTNSLWEGLFHQLLVSPKTHRIRTVRLLNFQVHRNPRAIGKLGVFQLLVVRVDKSGSVLTKRSQIRSIIDIQDAVADIFSQLGSFWWGNHSSDHRILSIGTRLESYEIRSYTGAGGMGEVYRVADTRLVATWP
jgi:hypothetical protein